MTANHFQTVYAVHYGLISVPQMGSVKTVHGGYGHCCHYFLFCDLIAVPLTGYGLVYDDGCHHHHHYCYFLVDDDLIAAPSTDYETACYGYLSHWYCDLLNDVMMTDDHLKRDRDFLLMFVMMFSSFVRWLSGGVPSMGCAMSSHCCLWCCFDDVQNVGELTKKQPDLSLCFHWTVDVVGLMSSSLFD